MTLAIRNPRFERREVRLPVPTNTVRGFVVSLTAEYRIPFMAWDISAHGVGVLLTDTLPVGDLVIIHFSFPTQTIVPCRVAWCDYGDDPSGIRAGFQASDPLETGFLDLVSYIE